MTLPELGLLAVGISLLALAVLFTVAWPRGKPCICDDADNCTCGGAWGGRK